ncbi:MAG TPA: anhydro-N-acetylmuramic acid kinase [Nitrospiria bacterium]
MKVIGLISGTSTDGVDAALVEITGRGISSRLKLLGFATYPYPKGLRPKLVRLTEAGTTEELCRLNVYVGEIFAQAAVRISGQCGIPMAQIALIGSHGQTICHQPNPRRIGRYSVRATLQIGEPSVIAERTGIMTVADFRPRDMAAGGEGAPLTPYLHYILFHNPERPRLVVNIGGINNITHLPAQGGLERILAFDAGPGNMLIDGSVQALSRGRVLMDREGRMAAKGRVHDGLLKSLMAHPFLGRKPPKTTGRETFGRDLIRRVLQSSKKLKLNPNDLLATVTAFTVRSISSAYERFIVPRGGVKEVIVGGGGSRNITLMKQLQGEFGTVPVETFEKFDLDSRALEAMAFALFAYGTVQGEPNNVPAATGAVRAVMMGKIVPGRMGQTVPGAPTFPPFPGTRSSPDR